MKKILSLGILFLCGMLLFGCGGGTPSTDASETEASVLPTEK